MITGSLSRFPPPPATGPQPRMWKNLGVIAQDHSGYIEAHYELKSFRDELDVDSEDEVRVAANTLLHALSSCGRAIGAEDTYVLQRTRGFLKVRLAVGYWNQATTMGGIA